CFDSVDLYCRLLAICFLFSCIAPTRHLPSFPTRRSSDLIDAINAASQPHHFLSVTKGGHSAIVSTAGNNDCHAILRGGKAPNYEDRKSTRLNSSHVKISYAVFCLKKKKKTRHISRKHITD